MGYWEGFDGVMRVDAEGKKCGSGYISADKECQAGKGSVRSPKLKVSDKEYDQLGDEYAEALDDVQKSGSSDPKKAERYNKAWKNFEAESKRRGLNPIGERFKYMNRRRSFAERALWG